MKCLIKKHRINLLFLTITIIAVFFWATADKPSDLTWKALSIIAIIMSAYLTFIHHRESVTLEKINLVLLHPEASAYIVKIFEFLKKNGPETIKKDNIEGNPELFAATNYILGFCDDLAIAIKNGVVDEALSKEMTWNFIKKIHKGLKPYIVAAEEYDKDSKYPHFDELVNKWEKEGK